MNLNLEQTRTEIIGQAVKNAPEVREPLERLDESNLGRERIAKAGEMVGEAGYDLDSYLEGVWRGCGGWILGNQC